MFTAGCISPLSCIPMCTCMYRLVMVYVSFPPIGGCCKANSEFIDCEEGAIRHVVSAAHMSAVTVNSNVRMSSGWALNTGTFLFNPVHVEEIDIYWCSIHTLP